MDVHVLSYDAESTCRVVTNAIIGVKYRSLQFWNDRLFVRSVTHHIRGYRPLFCVGRIPQHFNHLLTEQEIDRKIDNIETTMARVLQDAESLPSTYAAMVAYAQRRIAGGNPADKERVHAG